MGEQHNVGSRYLLGHDWHGERERLGAIDRIFGVRHRAQLRSLGLAEGWRCLEVGAGAGHLTEWLCEQVGPSGQVVATDLDTRFLEALEIGNLEVRHHDIVADPLEEAAYDLVFARLVLEHLPARESVLERMLAAARPGGLVVLAETDFSTCVPYPSTPSFAAVLEGIITLLTAAGWDGTWACRAPGAMAAVGAVDVDADGWLELLHGKTPEMDSTRLTVGRLAEPLVTNGLASPEQVAEVSDWLDNPGFTLVSSLYVTSWGRRPA